MTPNPWDRRIERARKLIAEYPAAAALLEFYAEIAGFQKRVYEALAAKPGTPELALLDPYFPALRALVSRIAPAPHDPSAGEPFLRRALLQPYTELQARRSGVATGVAAPTCPFCGEKPQAAILREEGDGGKRWLICSLCSTEWEFRRVLCPGCGEESLDRLPVYKAAQFEHVRLEACDTCRVYIKSFDLTRNALAVPPVDDLATVPLNIWAEENGYSKLQPNLLGM
jgi:FdhE protein